MQRPPCTVRPTPEARGEGGQSAAPSHAARVRTTETAGRDCVPEVV